VKRVSFFEAIESYAMIARFVDYTYRRLPEYRPTILKVIEAIVLEHQNNRVSVQDNGVT